jgi:hypothetical protein
MEPALLNHHVVVAYTTTQPPSKYEEEFVFVSVKLGMTSSPTFSTADWAENCLPVSAALIMWRKGVPGIASPVTQPTDRAAMVSSIPD